MRRLSLFLLCAALLVGCSNRTFIGRGYDNFTAYYNTFYNAQKAFEKGVDAADQRDQPVNRARYLTVFSEPSLGNTEAFDRAIKKSADVLRDHPNSKWVDDALMLIGKSYFYQGNYVGAEQKFREVIALDSGLEGEARFWLARGLIAAGRYNAASEQLSVSLSQDEDFGRWTDLMYLVQGDLYVSQSDWSSAAEALARGLGGDVDDEAAARAAFLLGQVRETLGEFDAAAEAFEQAASYRPRYELSYAARISAIRVKGLHGHPKEALDELRQMETDDKNFEKRAELRLLRGRLYQADGRLDRAREIYRDLLYGDDPARGDVAGRVHYALGELHRDAFENYSVAAAHFDTASTSLGRSGGRGTSQQEQVPAPAAITDSGQQAGIFGNVAERAQAVSRLDSLLRLGTMEEDTFRTFIADLREQRARERATREEAQREREAARQFTTQNTQNGSRRNARSNPTTAAAATSSSDAGFLFHNDPVRVQEARRNFEQRWGRRPLVPNWRRREAISAQTASDDSGDSVEATDSVAVPRGTTGEAGAIASTGEALVDISAVPRDSASQAQMRSELAVAQYELGNALFLSIGRPDSAITWYRRVVEQDANKTVARRALYALAEAHAARGDTTQAQTLYRRVIDRYPSSDFADRAREQLGQEQVARSATDTTALAETAYASAYDAWRQDRHNEALQEMVRVAEQYPRTTVAPRALLAAGSIFMEKRPPDSLKATTPLPKVFESILKAQPKTTASPDTARQSSASPDTVQTRRRPVAPDTSLIRRKSPAPDSIRSREQAAVPSDSAQGAPPKDSLQSRPPADSLNARSAPDSMQVGVDTLAADSLLRSAPIDSLAGAGKSEQTARSDAAAPSGPVLRTLFAHITQQYPESAQAVRAKRIMTALDEKAASAAPADTRATPADTGVVSRDSTAAPSSPADSAMADSIRTSAPADSAPADSAPADSAPADSVQADSVRTDSVRTDSVRTDSVRADSVRTDSVRTDSVATSPVDSTEAHSEEDQRIPPPPSPRADTSSTEQPLPAPRPSPNKALPDTSSTRMGAANPPARPDSTGSRDRN